MSDSNPASARIRPRISAGVKPMVRRMAVSRMRSAHSHRNGVGRDEQNRERHRAADGGEEEFQVAEEGEEAQGKIFFRFGLGQRGRVGEAGVD